MTTNYYACGTTPVTTTATLIGIYPASDGSIVPPGVGIWIKNIGPETVYLGDSQVSADPTNAAGGFPLSQGEKILLPAPTGTTQFELYAITSEGTAYVTNLFIGANY